LQPKKSVLLLFQINIDYEKKSNERHNYKWENH